LQARRARSDAPCHDGHAARHFDGKANFGFRVQGWQWSAHGFGLVKLELVGHDSSNIYLGCCYTQPGLK
jgi:hypothetical protein